MIGVVRRIDLGPTITLNTGTPDADGVEWWGRVAAGWGSPPVRRAVTNRPGRGGAWAGAGLFGPRAVTLEGSMVAPTSAALSLALGRIRALLGALDTDTALTVAEPVPKSLLVRPSDGSDAYEDTETIGRFTASLLAVDPTKYGPATVYTLALPSGGTGGLTFPAIAPFVFTAGGGAGTATVVNAGTDATRPVWEVTGPATNPRLRNDSTGEVMELTTTLLAGDTLVVDHRAQTVTLAGVSRAATKTPSSTWWSLAPGNTVVRYTAAAYNATTRAYVTVAGAYP